MDPKERKRTIRIELTPEQREQMRIALGKDTPVLELTPEALEERVAPVLGLPQGIQD